MPKKKTRKFGTPKNISKRHEHTFFRGKCQVTAIALKAIAENSESSRVQRLRQAESGPIDHFSATTVRFTNQKSGCSHFARGIFDNPSTPPEEFFFESYLFEAGPSVPSIRHAVRPSAFCTRNSASATTCFDNRDFVSIQLQSQEEEEAKSYASYTEHTHYQRGAESLGTRMIFPAWLGPEQAGLPVITSIHPSTFNSTVPLGTHAAIYEERKK
ncbi:hypothetical protein C8R47DRAFT_1202921 [Mycena vitilis]|nr:hypothetical protein C8R47DRAFT_1202921 [Mycena vitilis]